jgi:hypothetical protein
MRKYPILLVFVVELKIKVIKKKRRKNEDNRPDVKR